MKRILMALVLAMPLLSFAQKTKTVNIAPMGYLNITGEIFYEADEKTPKDTVYTMTGVDNQFNYNQSYDQFKHIPLASGSFQKMYDIMQSSLNLFNEEVGVNVTKYDVRMSLRRPETTKRVALHSSIASDNGYTLVTTSNVREIISRMEYYARDHKIALKQWK